MNAPAANRPRNFSAVNRVTLQHAQVPAVTNLDKDAQMDLDKDAQMAVKAAVEVSDRLTRSWKPLTKIRTAR
jgi:hypothetical protein